MRSYAVCHVYVITFNPYPPRPARAVFCDSSIIIMLRCKTSRATTPLLERIHGHALNVEIFDKLTCQPRYASPSHRLARRASEHASEEATVVLS